MTTEGPIQVAAGNDDAHEKDRSANFSATTSTLTPHAALSSNARWNAGFRFQSVDIANGDTIDDVDLEVYNLYTNGNLYVNVYANDVDDAVDFSTDADVTTRVDSASTAASAAWTHAAAAAGAFISSSTDGVDLTAVIQEVIDRGGWATGQDVVMLLQGREDVGTQNIWVRAYEGSSALAAKITIDYTIGGGGPPTIASRRLLSGVGR